MKMLNQTMSKYQEKSVKYADFDYIERFSGKFYTGKLLINKVFNCFGAEYGMTRRVHGLHYPMHSVGRGE